MGSWLSERSPRRDAQELVQKITNYIQALAKRKEPPSKIGKILRDSGGIPQVKTVCGMKILRIIKLAGLDSDVPEDLFSLTAKAKRMREHIERDHRENKNDKDQVFHLKNTDAKIKRLERYYKKSNKINRNYKSDSRN